SLSGTREGEKAYQKLFPSVAEIDEMLKFFLRGAAILADGPVLWQILWLWQFDAVDSIVCSDLSRVASQPSGRSAHVAELVETALQERSMFLDPGRVREASADDVRDQLIRFCVEPSTVEA